MTHLRVRLPLVYAGELIEPTTVQVLDELGQPVNLTGATITCAMQIGERAKTVRSGSLVDAVNGILRVTWTEADFIAAGRIRGVITYSVGSSERVAADIRGRVRVSPVEFNPAASSGGVSETIKQDFSRKRGDTWEFEFFFEYGGRRVNLTDSTWQMDLRDEAGTLFAACVFDGSHLDDGVVTMTVSASVTGTAVPGTPLLYDLEQMMGSLTATPYEGVLTVTADIT